MNKHIPSTKPSTECGRTPRNTSPPGRRPPGVQRSQKGRSLQNCCCSYSALEKGPWLLLPLCWQRGPPHKSAGGQAVALGERYGRQDWEKQCFAVQKQTKFVIHTKPLFRLKKNAESGRKRLGRQAAGGLGCCGSPALPERSQLAKLLLFVFSTLFGFCCHSVGSAAPPQERWRASCRFGRKVRSPRREKQLFLFFTFQLVFIQESNRFLRQKKSKKRPQTLGETGSRCGSRAGLSTSPDSPFFS